MGEDPISEFKKSVLVYQFKCFCEDSNTEMTSRQFGKWIKEHIPINTEGVFKTGNKKI